MGWQKATWNRRQIVVGDEPVDLVQELLRTFANCYTEEMGRKPTTDEFVYSLLSALRTTGRDVFADLATSEVSAVKVVSRKAPKTCKYATGDYFAIALPNGEFAYGRIIGSDSAGQVIEVFHLRSRNRFALERLKAQKQEVLFHSHVNGLAAFRSGRWPILGHEKLARNHAMPSFRAGDWSTFWTLDGYVASTDEAMQAEPMVCWNPETIEARIISKHPEILAEVEELNCQHFGDSYLKIIQYPAELQKLYLRAAVSDSGMKHLASCSNLKVLDVMSQPISDLGLRHLAKLTSLEELDLSKTKITDAGLVHLRGLKNLRKLGLAGTHVTDRAIAGLRKALPGVAVEKNGLPSQKR